MRAAVVRSFGDAGELRCVDWPTPEPAAGEVVVRVHAVTAASLDTRIRSGGAALGVELPRILGMDAAGEVAARGAGAVRFAPGARVAVWSTVRCGTCESCRGGGSYCARPRVIGFHRDGGQAEYVAVPEQNLVAIPDHVTFRQAASMALTYPTAWGLLVEGAAVQPGESVLVMAAGGGVGIAAIRLAQALGARVIAAAGSDWKLERCRELLDVEHVVDYSRPDWPDVVREHTRGRGVNVVVENISSPELFGGAIGSLAPEGRLVTCGAHGGGVVEVDMAALYLRRQRIIGVNAATAAGVEDVWRLVADGVLEPPPICHVVPLRDVGEAHRLIEARANFGRVVLDVVADDADKVIGG